LKQKAFWHLCMWNQKNLPHFFLNLWLLKPKTKNIYQKPKNFVTFEIKNQKNLPKTRKLCDLSVWIKNQITFWPWKLEIKIFYHKTKKLWPLKHSWANNIGHTTYLWKEGNLFCFVSFCNYEIHQTKMLQIVFLVSLESSWWGGVHGLGSMTFGLACNAKVLDHWMIFSLKIIYRS
jgi:hypothetical protein